MGARSAPIKDLIFFRSGHPILRTSRISAWLFPESTNSFLGILAYIQIEEVNIGDMKITSEEKLSEKARPDPDDT
jgi:hypothetical protein